MRWVLDNYIGRCAISLGFSSGYLVFYIDIAKVISLYAVLEYAGFGFLQGDNKFYLK